jgi:hypothetical protein
MTFACYELVEVVAQLATKVADVEPPLDAV